jgi:hypothetical protein
LIILLGTSVSSWFKGKSIVTKLTQKHSLLNDYFDLMTMMAIAAKMISRPINSTFTNIVRLAQGANS